MEQLFKVLKIKPNNQELYLEALTHPSYANEHQTTHNERLEFLGDSVIQILMSRYLYDNIQEDQGVLTKMRAKSVREEALHIFANQINLKDYMRVGHGIRLSGFNPAIIADCFEAIFAAIYLDLGLDQAAEVFERIVVANLHRLEKIKDHKTVLQELIQGSKRILSYRTIQIGGTANSPEFKSEVFLDQTILLATGYGKSKKIAEQEAAKLALEKAAKEV